MQESDKGWGKLVEFMLSGSPGACVLWAVLAYGVWATFYTNWRDHDGGMPWHQRKEGGTKRRWFDMRRID